LIEYNAGEGMLEMALAGADKELATIEGLMAELEPHRRYKDLPLLEATEAAQLDEWREEFRHRTENYLLSTGVIPHDQLEAMRKHPDFEAAILPHIKKTMLVLENAKSTSNAVMLLKNHPSMLPSNKKEEDAA
jgi:hypothetical protein